jgi:acetolactate synthase-1/2/3 large subunit
MPTGAEFFVQALEALGINEIFTLVGDHLNEILSVAGRRGMRVLDMRHESGVTHAADAWARIHRRPSLALVTGGPGHTNALTGIATAYQACSPLIACSGAPSSALAGRQVFQSIDQVGMCAPVVKWSATPTDPGQIPYLLGRAYAEAQSGRMGPVHLTIPVDIFAGRSESPLPMPQPPARPAAAPSARELERALELLRAAERPIAIGGSGLWWSDATAALQRFLAKTRLPFYSVTMARGLVPDGEGTVLGYADGSLNKAVHKAFPAADVVLVLGKRIDYRLALGGPRLFSPSAQFIQVDIHAPELGANRRLEVGLASDCRSALDAMTSSLGSGAFPERAGWLEQLRRWDAEWRDALERTAVDRGSPPHPAAFFFELRKVLPPDTLYSWDGGDFVHWGRAILPARVPGGWLRLGPLGTIGSALPNAFALSLAHPGKPVVMITGDGSLGFYIAELDSLVRHGLPVVIVVGNDGGWGLERELQQELCGSTVACELRRTRYDLVMEAFGGMGENVDRLDQVAPALERALGSGRPYLVNVNVRGSRSPFTEWQIGGKKGGK